MLAKLTLKLLAHPEQGWPHLAAAHSLAPDSPGSLPTPLQHAVAAGFVSVFATGLGWMLRPGATSGGTVLQMLSATVGYVGGAACAVMLTPRVLRTGASSELVSRFASGAVLPLSLSGIVNVVPLPPLSLVLALAGTAASAQSAWIGASALLALEGPARTRAAAVPAGLAVSLVLLATFVRMVLPT